MPCAKGMAYTGPGRAGCRVGCLHRASVLDYYETRQTQEDRAEHTHKGYATERARYYGTDGEGPGTETRYTFKQHLINHKRETQK